ncbi:uncharacterized protein [Blastocystis hominis]|uniref:Endonuclease/exonuclease/phosphatase domain-containing protein n=1 Tax=Blastocystis hominis TaxID=12968 RepID=D8M626_BLAHO|nr:uncharacterized protein [Blastocystis hominis]CBK23625.2 unnamed protein product [Blastocystis hominis]|eukprot:XP_012897673.1 uncharacterized protein [Blastocystis hominis]
MSDISADCIPEGYDAFSSHCAHNGGYSGVITFLGSFSQHPKSTIYQRYDSDFVKSADMEGRVCFTFFDNCAILNVYFPCGSEEDSARCSFRERFYELIMDLVKIIKVDYPNCILLGDFNTAIACRIGWRLCYHPKSSSFYLAFMIRDGGCGMIDCFRALYPSERNAYSCFNTKLKGRINNFGTRIDYIVCTRPLRNCLVECAIRSDVTGSDHLPVVAEFDFSVKSESSVVGLRSKVGEQPKILSFFRVNRRM